MRKGCRPDKKVFEFQIAIVSNLITSKNYLTKRNLEIINETILTSNLNFMEQNGIIIEYVTQVYYKLYNYFLPDIITLYMYLLKLKAIFFWFEFLFLIYFLKVQKFLHLIVKLNKNDKT